MTTDPGSVSPLNSKGLGTIYGDIDPAFDDCSDSSHTSTNPVGVLTGKNIGDLLNAKHVTWGWFQGGFAPTGTNSAGYAVCGSEHENIGGVEVQDYVPHHDPFQFYKSTANPKHLPPTSEAAIGRTDQANHQYDLSDFYSTLKDGNMPAVSFLKAACVPGRATPATPTRSTSSTSWSTRSTRSKRPGSGSPRRSSSPMTTLTAGMTTRTRPGSTARTPSLTLRCAPVEPTTLGSLAYRCGYGPRLPLVVISPYTSENHVSQDLTDQSSIIKFIEDNWLHGERIGGGSFDQIAGSLDAPGGVLNFRARPHFAPVILDPTTGEVVSH